MSELASETQKPCTKCREVKPLAGFHKNPVTKDGRHTICKPCRNARVLEAHYRKIAAAVARKMEQAQ